jgi:N-acetylglucosaminyl-diphospho-decaprenol L-rhamnosyltransferase
LRNKLAETTAHHRAPVIVVDNGSDDPVRLADAEVIRLDANLRAPARNVGVERARTPFVAFAATGTGTPVVRDYPGGVR